MAKTSDNLTEEEKVKILRDRAVSKSMSTIEKIIHVQSGVWTFVECILQQLTVWKRQLDRYFDIPMSSKNIYLFVIFFFSDTDVSM